MTSFPIIGISGPSHSGKDLVADWFCQKKGFQKVAFADPIKRFAHEIFGFGSEALWGDPELREKPSIYSEEQWLGFLASFSSIANPFINEMVPVGTRVYGYISLMEWLHDMRRLHEDARHITCRVVLQTFGTEWGRKKIDPLLWVNHLYDKVAPVLERGSLYKQDKGLYQFETSDGRRAPGPSGIVIPDHRFMNEIEETKRRGHYCIRLRRLSKEQKFKEDNVGIVGHQSEVEMRDIPDSAFDRVLELEEGKDSVYAILEKLFEERPWDNKNSDSALQTSSNISGIEKESPSDTA